MKEKYITQRKRNGHIVYEVTFKYFDKETKIFSKSFNSRDYNTPKEALEEAIKERDKVRLELAEHRLKRSTIYVVECRLNVRIFLRIFTDFYGFPYG